MLPVKTSKVPTSAAPKNLAGGHLPPTAGSDAITMTVLVKTNSPLFSLLILSAGAGERRKKSVENGG